MPKYWMINDLPSFEGMAVNPIICCRLRLAQNRKPFPIDECFD